MSTKPEAGQWWFNCTTFGCDAKRNGVRIQDVLSDTQVLIEGVQGCWEVWPRDELSGGWHHEPRCTGWDWVVPQPAEDPDEWVEITDPDHVLRSCDQLTATENVKKDDIVGEWQGCMSAEELVAVGRRLSERRSMRFRCRHRDLPKVEQAPQPQKTRVRLWIEGPTKMVMCRDKAPYGDWQELHHDSDGFYVENQR